MLGATGFDLDSYQRCLMSWMGDRCPTGGLFIGMPHRDTQVSATNQFIEGEMQSDPRSRGMLLVTPNCDPVDVAVQLDKAVWAGIKVYHCYAPREDTFSAPIEEFVADWMW